MTSADDESFEDDACSPQANEPSAAGAGEWAFLVEDVPVGPSTAVIFEGPKHYGRETWNHYTEEFLRKISSETVLGNDQLGVDSPHRLSEDEQPNQGLPDLRKYRLRPLWSEPGDPSQPQPIMPDLDDFDERERSGWKADEAVDLPDRLTGSVSRPPGVETDREEPTADEGPTAEDVGVQSDDEDGQALPVRRPEPKDDEP